MTLFEDIELALDNVSAVGKSSYQVKEEMLIALRKWKKPIIGIFQENARLLSQLLSAKTDAENWRKFKDAIAYYEDDEPKTFEEYVHVTLKELVELREKFTKDGKCKE